MLLRRLAHALLKPLAQAYNQLVSDQQEEADPVENALGELLKKERTKRQWSLRDVEEKSGIHNAHLSQIESGAIARPAPNLLFTLAAVYDLRYDELMRLAGHLKADDRKSRRSLQGAALHALDELTPKEQRRALEYMKSLRADRAASGRRAR
jgi:transcriptional regulator with XRE-family HTH domain